MGNLKIISIGGKFSTNLGINILEGKWLKMLSVDFCKGKVFVIFSALFRSRTSTWENMGIPIIFFSVNLEI